MINCENLKGKDITHILKTQCDDTDNKKLCIKKLLSKVHPDKLPDPDNKCKSLDRLHG